MKSSCVNYRAAHQLLLGAASFFLFAGTAWACLETDDSVEIPRYVYAVIISIIFALLIIGTTYLVKRLFFKTTNLYSAGIIAVLAFAFTIGLLGSFIIPEYQKTFVEMGVALSIHTELLLKYKHLLWFPLLIAAMAVWRLNSTKIKLSWILFFIGAEIFLLTMVFWSLYSSIFILACAR